MQRKLEIKVAEGFHLRDPSTGQALETGVAVVVPDTTFWRRRIRFGEAELVRVVEPEPADDKAAGDQPADAQPAAKARKSK